MKKTVGISLFIFFATVVAILLAGLIFYQNNKTNNTSVPTINTPSSNSSNSPSTSSISNSSAKLNMTEVAKHNKTSDCYLVINGKVYDITSYFGSHPGGNRTMTTTCGTDATSAYGTKGGGQGPHSSYAVSLLSTYYIGGLVQ